jgi:hypothetical protein
VPQSGALAAPPVSQALKGSDVVTVTIPLVAILGALVWLAWRFLGLRTWHAVLCLLLGFLLAATSAAPEIRHIVTGVVRSLGGH